MKRTIFWSIASALMVLSLVMAACAPAAPAPTAPTAPTTPAPTTPTAPTAPAAPAAPAPETPQKEVAAPETPKYGGTITIVDTSDPTCCDSAANRIMSGGLIQNYVYEQILDFDWARGPAGTGEYDNRVVTTPDALMGPTLVESVEKPSPEVWVMKVRQGVHWQVIPGRPASDLMKGREMTADDIVWGYERMVHGPNSAMKVLQPRVAEAFTIEKTGPWEVTFTTKVQPITAQWWVIEGGGHAVLHPREVVEKYGDVNNWRNSVGTSPWILMDYVPGSQVIYKRNPNYWGTDPAGPGKGNQLPYADGIRRLIIPDASTRFAALRTGKLDLLGGLTKDDADQIISTAPGISYDEYLGTGFGNAHAVAFNMSDPSKPWADKRVRQALMMATDYDTIVKDYFKGKAEMDTVLVNRNFEGRGYKPLSTMPESVQELYRYNPEKAGQLLTEAGYPNGFKAELLVPTAAARMDEAAIIKGMWSKVGVELNIVPKETAVLTAMVTRQFDWTDTFYGGAGSMVGSFGFSLYTYFGYYRGDNRLQFASRTDPGGKPDPLIESAFDTTQKNLYINWPAAYKAVEEIRPYLIENAFKIPFPQPFEYTFWWPWMKNTHGQGPVTVFLKYFWIDQDLKKSMGY